jgi:TetR/AcrR family transcriptional repressor of nem operon
MKVTRELAARHRQALLEQGGRMFRRHGIGGVSVAGVARAAGLTHGAFYGHFASKAALVAEAVGNSLEVAAGHWRRRAERARAEGRDPLAVLVAGYVNERHRDAPETGCVLAALGPEVARADAPVAEALRTGTDALAAVLAEEIGRRDPGLCDEARRDRALAMLAALTGGLVLARALATDETASRAALRAAAALALAAAERPSASS